MDSQSVITQVCREEINSNSPSCVSKVEAKPPVNVVKSNVSSSNKAGQGNLLSRLLCCFRPGVSQSSDTLQQLNNHSSNLNGSSKSGKRNGYKSQSKCLLKPVAEELSGRICLVVDLDETLVHSSFQPVKNADFIIPVEIDGVNHQVYVLKRPHVDEFLKKIGQLFECVLFTASLGKYADPVTDLLDKWSVFQARLFRESCVFHMGNYIKDMSLLGREVDRVVIVDNSPISYLFHPRNAIPVLSWFDDPNDHELRDLIPLLEQLAASNDIYHLLSNHQRQQGHSQQLCSNGKALNSAFPSSSSSSSSSFNSTLNSTFSPPPLSNATNDKLNSVIASAVNTNNNNNNNNNNDDNVDSNDAININNNNNNSISKNNSNSSITNTSASNNNNKNSNSDGNSNNTSNKDVFINDDVNNNKNNNNNNEELTKNNSQPGSSTDSQQNILSNIKKNNTNNSSNSLSSEVSLRNSNNKSKKNSNNNINNSSNNNINNISNNSSSSSINDNSSNNLTVKLVARSKKKLIIAEMIVDCNKELNNDTLVQQQQQQQQTITTKRSSNIHNNADTINPSTNIQNEQQQQKPTVVMKQQQQKQKQQQQQQKQQQQQQHKSSAPELQTSLQRRSMQHPSMPPQRNSYQPISSLLHKPSNFSSVSSTNIHNYA